MAVGHEGACWAPLFAPYSHCWLTAAAAPSAAALGAVDYASAACKQLCYLAKLPARQLPMPQILDSMPCSCHLQSLAMRRVAGKMPRRMSQSSGGHSANEHGRWNMAAEEHENHRAGRHGLREQGSLKRGSKAKHEGGSKARHMNSSGSGRVGERSWYDEAQQRDAPQPYLSPRCRLLITAAGSAETSGAGPPNKLPLGCDGGIGGWRAGV